MNKRRLSILYILLILITIGGIFQPVWGYGKRLPVVAEHGMVVCADPLAAEIGVDVLKKGGNAIDAAVATAFALAVIYPSAGNLGGGGFMMIQTADGESYAIDGREAAPGQVDSTYYLPQKDGTERSSLWGYTASGTPGTVALLTDVHASLGTLPLAELVQPAIDLAENGFVVSEFFANSLRSYAPYFVLFPGSAKIFLKEVPPDSLRKPSAMDGLPLFMNMNRFFYQPGDIFKQKDLANTLTTIAQNGRDGFYQGIIPQMVEKEMSANGGALTAKDFEQYQIKVREPVIGSYHGYEIISMPPPSSGGIALIQLLNILEEYDLEWIGHNSSETIHLMAEAERRVYADRSEHIGDPDFVDVPIDGLVSKIYADQMRDRIDRYRATPSRSVKPGTPPGDESYETTHICVIDSLGNAVSMTLTLNTSFGSKVVIDGAGFLLNNEMNDFTIDPSKPNHYGLRQGRQNRVEPYKRPVSSMTPTILLKNGKPVMLVGSPGGSTIITTVMQIIVNVIEHGMNIQEAINAPRIHHQWYPDRIYIEKYGLSTDVIQNLTYKGHRVRVHRWGYIGRAEGILIDYQTGKIHGASDPRGQGAAKGY